MPNTAEVAKRLGTTHSTVADGGARPFDGVICFGAEDWWYHNRGHFDFQIMTRLARKVPVLFVNSIGVRVPSLRHGRQFAAKIRRKLTSMSRGLVEAEPNFFVHSPLAVPGGKGWSLNARLLAMQVRAAARRAGMRRPALWICCPPAADLIDFLPHDLLVLQRTDRFEAFPEADPQRITNQIAVLKRRADLTIYCNSELMAEETSDVARQAFVTHGVDVARFVDAGLRSPDEAPDDVAALPRPRVGFIGGIDAHTFGIDLFRDTAARMPDVTFAMVGACSLPDGWCPSPNVHFLGRKPYSDIAGYMAAMDVLIMPWNDSAWIKAANPIKLKEYLAVGRPVVTTDFSALAPYRDLVWTANSAEDFTLALREALALGCDPAEGRRRIQNEDWNSKADDVWRHMLETVAAKSGGAAQDCAGNGVRRMVDAA